MGRTVARILQLRDDPQIDAAIVEPVVVEVVYHHADGAIGNDAMQSNEMAFAPAGRRPELGACIVGFAPAVHGKADVEVTESLNFVRVH